VNVLHAMERAVASERKPDFVQMHRVTSARITELDSFAAEHSQVP
jgi:hypothetical protein